jgi:hypothetical protein
MGRKQRPRVVRWPEQRDAFALLGLLTTDLRRWLGCTYGRARDLRDGVACLRGCELGLIAKISPVSAEHLTRHMAPADVRRRQLALFADES